MVPKRAKSAQSNCNRPTVAIRMTLSRNAFHRVGGVREVLEKVMVGEPARAGSFELRRVLDGLTNEDGTKVASVTVVRGEL